MASEERWYQEALGQYPIEIYRPKRSLENENPLETYRPKKSLENEHRNNNKNNNKNEN